MGILMMLIFLIYEHGMCLYLFVTSLISFLLPHNFLSTGLLYLWLILFQRCFILFEAIVNGIVFLVSLCSYLVNKNSTDFWILILHPAILLNSLRVLVVFDWIFRNLYIQYRVICSYITTSFQFCCLLHLVIWLLWRTSITRLNKSSKSERPCLIPDYKGNTFIFVHWVWCWLWGCHIWPLLPWDMFPLLTLFWEFLS